MIRTVDLEIKKQWLVEIKMYRKLSFNEDLCIIMSKSSCIFVAL